MRILHVSKRLQRRGGAAHYMLDLGDLQCSAGQDVAFCEMAHPDDGLQAALEELRPEVVHAHDVGHQLAASVVHAARRRGVPVVLTVQDDTLVCTAYRLLEQDGGICTVCMGRGRWTAVRHVCRAGSGTAGSAAGEVSLHRSIGARDGVRRFIAPSRFLGGQVVASGVDARRVRIQPGFTDTSVPVGPAVPVRHAVVAGRLSREKGVDVLIRAVGLLPPASLPALDRDGVLLEVVGDGPERAHLQLLADQVARGRVRFHGDLPHDDLGALVGEATVRVVPSRWLESPRAVLEAFARGVPVIASGLGAVPELVDDSTGWLVQPGDVVGFAGALRQALGDPARAREIGASARRRVVRDHAASTHLAAISRIYQEVRS